MVLSHYEPREQVPRAGLGAPDARLAPLPRLERRWTQTLFLHSAVAAGATDVRASRLLAQPFRVDDISIQTDAGLDQDVRVNLYADNVDSGTGDTLDRGRAGLWQTQNEGLQANEVRPARSDFTILAGTIFRNTPTRIVLAAFNNTATPFNVTAVVTVTFLETHEEPTDPPTYP